MLKDTANNGAALENNQQQDNLLSDNIFDNTDIDDFEPLESLIDSRLQPKRNFRLATRVIRRDISSSINAPGLLSFGKTIPVDLIDISSRGIQISTDQRLAINKKIIMTLKFKSGKVFVIKGMVIRRSDLLRHEYGIKFDCYNNELGDYLLETQEKLIFK